MSKENFLAIGADELGKEAKEGALIICNKCKEHHALEYGINNRGEKTNKILFYKCGDSSYLAGIDGKLLKTLTLAN